ncbi:DNA/RNA helicase domain-containing protein [Burkholderia pyrrocinia]|uniref:DNA/RNA helicase domain-containing protein n=1 Tax=Burkholderia pyrrocinia TaxID=60550 RepID=UPI0030CB1DA0
MKMSKRINIQSLLQASKSLPVESFKGFLQHYGIEIKAAEIEDLRILAGVLSALEKGFGIFDKYYIGYKIPQIGKEFDLLRFGTDFIVNVEIKKTCSEEKIKKQLRRNEYYLGFIGRPVYSTTFVSDLKKFYFLQEDGNLGEVDAGEVVKLLVEQEVNDAEIPDNLFNPSDFLVSPFNSTDKFLNGQYFLTHQQEDIKDQIFNSLCEKKAPTFVSLMGGAGTGKTLLIYDIAKRVMVADGKPLVIHCGQLNSGHMELMRSGWKVVAIKDYVKRNLVDYNLIIVDEAQRIKAHQLDDIVEKVKAANGFCIFSHDKLQTLADWEARDDISEKINSIVPIVKYTLSEKIRTNREIADFIKMLFFANKTVSIPNNENIEINYFGAVQDAKNYLDGLDERKWQILRFTPSQYNNEHHEKYGGVIYKTSHQVIGQEFDGVAVTIDEYFSYNDDGHLIYTGKTYYQPAKMLFQNITRSRRRLNLVIVNNEQVLNRCISILQAK